MAKQIIYKEKYWSIGERSRFPNHRYYIVCNSCKQESGGEMPIGSHSLKITDMCKDIVPDNELIRTFKAFKFLGKL